MNYSFIGSLLKDIAIIFGMVILTLLLLTRLYSDFVPLKLAEPSLVSTTENIVYRLLGKHGLNSNCVEKE
jgi:hypothetical protein